jgi:histidyl-tRNA synthetase
MSSKPSPPKGTRDFLPAEMQRRKFIFGEIETVFKKYGFLPLETPSFEMLSTLTGKYGEEGDQLMFRILNSGDFLDGVQPEEINSGYKKLSPRIAEKALRYDLTIPFARVVATRQQDIPLPFRRYQIQPVWRADRPQKGRYREFYQCDADIVGSDSLTLEAELAALYAEVFQRLKIPQVRIHLNNRKILAGIAEYCGEAERLTEMTIALDKLDKIGQEGVRNELEGRGFDAGFVEKLFSIEALFSQNTEQSAGALLGGMKEVLKDSETGIKGISELETVLVNLEALSPKSLKSIQVDFTLARGLNYYTGMIFEVKTSAVKMGSIGGGGRYDNLTGTFGLKGISGVGISFGADRIYDVLEELNAFPDTLDSPVKVCVANFGPPSQTENLKLLALLRQNGLAAEYFPDEKKLQKQIEYALKKNIPWMILQGEAEIQKGGVELKNLQKSEQIFCLMSELIEVLK